MSKELKFFTDGLPRVLISNLQYDLAKILVGLHVPVGVARLVHGVHRVNDRHQAWTGASFKQGQGILAEPVCYILLVLVRKEIKE